MNNFPLISVIIRTKNEEKYLEQVLIMLKKQTFQDFEIIIVDNQSTDKTLEIAKKYHCKIIHIPKDKFSHPYSCNIGAKNSKGKYLVYLNGHSIPVTKTFLKDGLNNFKDASVAGVYAHSLPHQDGTLADKILYLNGYFKNRLFIAKKKYPGIMATTNAMLRKKLWSQYHFQETFNQGWGGEDSDWAEHFIKLGYKIIHDPKFKVRHSHHLSFKDFFWQLRNWKKMYSTNKKIPKKQKRNF